MIPKIPRSIGLRAILGWVLCLGMACTLSSSLLTPESEPTPAMMTATPETPQESFSLPAPLYYLQAGQIWRLAPDTQSQQQITHEDMPINTFEVAPDDGRLVFVSNNSLIITDSDGGNRQILRAGASLADIPDELARLNDVDQITTAIRSPHWSPDGKQITFIENGVQLFEIETNQVVQIWSQSITSSEPSLFENVLSWSPDGKHLLVSQYAYPLQTLGHRRLSVLELGGSLYMDVAAAAHATFAWSPDATQLYLANAGFGWDNSLMRCEMPGWRCTLIAEFVPARTYFFYAHPFVINEQELMVFSGGNHDPDEQPAEFKLYKITSQGYGYQLLRSDGFLPQSALWSPDGAGVVITLAQAAGVYPAGYTVWLSSDDKPPNVLPIMNVSNLRWGGSQHE